MSIDELILKAIVPLLSNSPMLLVLAAMWVLRAQSREEAAVLANRIAKTEKMQEKLLARHLSLHPKDARYLLDERIDVDDEPPTIGSRER
jgi:hypothetical protein